MPVVIQPLGLGRERRAGAGGSPVVINGSGFSAVPAMNTVLVGGISAPIVAESSTQITFNYPVPFSLDDPLFRDLHAKIEVINLTTGEKSGAAWVFIPADDTEVADAPLDSALPGPFAQLGNERPRFLEAVDAERLAALIESFTRDIQPGNVLAWDGTKVAEPAGLKARGVGSLLQVDLAEATSLKWGLLMDVMLPFGGRFNAGTVLLDANGNPEMTAGGPSEQWVLADGTLDLISVDPNLASGTLDRVRLLVDGAQVFDSGVGLALTTPFSAVIAVAVTAGSFVELEITKLVLGFGFFSATVRQQLD